MEQNITLKRDLSATEVSDAIAADPANPDYSRFALRKPDPAAQAEAQERFAEMRRERAEREAALPGIRAAGEEALRRLLPIAQGHSGQCRYVAGFLLSLYNGERFKFDLTDLRAIDSEIFDDCIAVLKMDHTPWQEVHRYFDDGGKIWEQLARDWRITDYTKLKTPQ